MSIHSDVDSFRCRFIQIHSDVDSDIDSNIRFITKYPILLQNIRFYWQNIRSYYETPCQNIFSILFSSTHLLAWYTEFILMLPLALFPDSFNARGKSYFSHQSPWNFLLQFNIKKIDFWPRDTFHAESTKYGTPCFVPNMVDKIWSFLIK